MTPRLQIDHPVRSYSGDRWDEFIARMNRWQVISVNNFRCHLTLGELDLWPELQEIMEQMKADALWQFDPRVIEANPPLLVSQEWHDSWHQERWGEVEAFVDQFCEEHFFSVVRQWPLEMSLNGEPDVEFSATIDLQSGCRRRTYVMRKSGRFDLTAERLPTLTLDTSVLFELWKSGSKVRVVRRLLELAKRQRASVRATGRIYEDVPRPPLADEIANLPALGVDLMSSVVRPHYWRVGVDTAGSIEFDDAHEALTSREDRALHRDWRDWDHLHAHFVNKRDVFLTWDKKLRRYGGGLKEILDITVMSPEEYILHADPALIGQPL